MVYKIGRKNIEIQIDEEDLHFLQKNNSSASITSHGYVGINFYLGFVDGKYKYKREYLHRLIMKPRKGYAVDHINNNKLDNRKENLRICINSNNAKNKKQFSGNYKGVYWSKKQKKWVAQITKNKKCKHIGSFEFEKDAALAYNREAKKLHGKYAFLNKI